MEPVGPDGYLYVLSYEGNDNCRSADENLSDWVKYESDILGTIFRIVPKIVNN